MAEFDYKSGIAIGVQSGLGTVNATIKALSGALDLTDGIVLGQSGQGIADDGIDDDYAREFTEKAIISGSFTRPSSDFLRESAEMSIFFPLRGSGKTTSTPVVDADFVQHVGIDAIYQAAGLAGSDWGGGVGRIYVPASAVPVTIKRWGNGFSWTLMDCFIDLKASLIGGEIPVWEATVAIGSVENFNGADAFPIFDFQVLGSVSAVAVETIGHDWGISAEARGFQNGELSIVNNIEEVEDSNAVGGVRKNQTGREIEFNGTIFGSVTDIDIEHVELVRTTAPTEQQQFQIGTAAGDAETAKAIEFILTTPELRSYKPNKAGNSWAIEILLRAVNAVANAEFSMIFK